MAVIRNKKDSFTKFEHVQRNAIGAKPTNNSIPFIFFFLFFIFEI